MSSITQAQYYMEYEEMLKLFRCQDLANLLQYAGQSKNGKKCELLERCLAILKKGNPSIQFKIKEIHNSRLIAANPNQGYHNAYLTNVVNNSNSNSSTSNSPDPTSMLLNNGSVARYPGTTSSSGSTSSASSSSSLFQPFNQYGGNPIAAAISLASSTGSHYAANQQQYANHLRGHSANPSTLLNPSNAANNRYISNMSGHPQHHAHVKVEFERLAFFDHLHELVAPIQLLCVHPNQRPLSFWFHFNLNQEQVNEILNDRELLQGRYEYVKQVHLRFGYYEQSVQKDQLPANLIVNVNQKPAQLPTPKPTSKPNADIIRPGRSIDVSHLLKLAPNSQNKVEISWTNLEPGRMPCVGVYMFKKISVSTLVAHLVKNCTKEAEVTRRMVIEKLKIEDADFLIETNTLKVSLLCPLMKFRIHLPGRAFNCKHVQCFDLESYLMMNEKKPTWNCPVCDQNAPFDNLIICGLFKEILAKVNDSSCEEVEFSPNGEWTKVGRQPPEKKLKTSVSSSSMSKSVAKQSADESLICEDICFDSPPNSSRTSASNNQALADDIEQAFNSNKATSVPVPAPAVAAAPEKNLQVIDLTLDSDDEQPAPAPPPPPAPPNETNKANKQAAAPQAQAASTSPLNPPQASSSSTCLAPNNRPNGMQTRSSTSSSSSSSSASSTNRKPTDLVVDMESKTGPPESDATQPVAKEPSNAIDLDNTLNEDGPASPSVFSVISLSSSESSDESGTTTPFDLDALCSPMRQDAPVEPTPLPTTTSDISNKQISNNIHKNVDYSGNKNLSIPPLTKQNTPPPQAHRSPSMGENTNSNNSRLARDLSMPSPSKSTHKPTADSSTQPAAQNSSARLAAGTSGSCPNVYPPKQSSSLASFDSIITNSLSTDPLDPTRNCPTTTTSRMPPTNPGSHLENAINNIKQKQQFNRPVPKAPLNSNSNSNPATSKQHASTNVQLQQQSKQYGMLNQNNKVNNSHKLASRQPEYLSVDKALKVREEIRQSASMANRMDVDSVNMHQQQQQQQQFNYRLKETNSSNLTAKIATSLRKNSFDADLPQHTMQQQQQQTNRLNSTPNKPPAAPGANPTVNRPVQPHMAQQQHQHAHQQQQRMQHPQQAQMNSNISTNKNMPTNKPNMQQNQSHYYQHQTWPKSDQPNSSGITKPIPQYPPQQAQQQLRPTNPIRPATGGPSSSIAANSSNNSNPRNHQYPNQPSHQSSNYMHHQQHSMGHQNVPHHHHQQQQQQQQHAQMHHNLGHHAQPQPQPHAHSHQHPHQPPPSHHYSSSASNQSR